jgi:hypothetical protein
MKKLKHKGVCDDVHPELSHEDWEIEEGSKETELDELLDFDGVIMNSKIPNNAPVATMLSKSTSDEVEKASQGSGGYFGSFYKRYWGDSLYEDEYKGLGDLEDFDLMSNQEVLDYFEDEHEFSSSDAESRALKTGAQVDSKGKLQGDEKVLKDSVTSIEEIQRQKMKDMLEVILNKKNDSGEIKQGQEIELVDINPILARKIKNLKKVSDSHGYEIEEIIKHLRK